MDAKLAQATLKIAQQNLNTAILAEIKARKSKSPAHGVYLEATRILRRDVRQLAQTVRKLQK